MKTKTDRFWRESEQGRGYHDNGPCVERESTTTKGWTGSKGTTKEVWSQRRGETTLASYWSYFRTKGIFGFTVRRAREMYNTRKNMRPPGDFSRHVNEAMKVKLIWLQSRKSSVRGQEETYNAPQAHWLGHARKFRVKESWDKRVTRLVQHEASSVHWRLGRPSGLVSKRKTSQDVPSPNRHKKKGDGECRRRKDQARKADTRTETLAFSSYA